MQLHVSFKNSLVLKRSTAAIENLSTVSFEVDDWSVSRQKSHVIVHTRAHECASVFVRNNCAAPLNH